VPRSLVQERCETLSTLVVEGRFSEAHEVVDTLLRENSEPSRWGSMCEELLKMALDSFDLGEEDAAALLEFVRRNDYDSADQKLGTSSPGVSEFVSMMYYREAVSGDGSFEHRLRYLGLCVETFTLVPSVRAFARIHPDEWVAYFRRSQEVIRLINSGYDDANEDISGYSLPLDACTESVQAMGAAWRHLCQWVCTQLMGVSPG
jgi:hypothetical protein